MPFRRRALLSALAAAALLPLPARAQWRSERPVRVIVPFAAGGNTDVVARTVAQPMGERLGRPFVIENRAGGAGSLAAAPAQPVACAAHEAAFPALIGRTEAEVRATLSAMPGIRAIRSGGPNTPMTMDYREDRATLTIVSGRVTRIICG